MTSRTITTPNVMNTNRKLVSCQGYPSHIATYTGGGDGIRHHNVASAIWLGAMAARLDTAANGPAADGRPGYARLYKPMHCLA